MSEPEMFLCHTNLEVLARAAECPDDKVPVEVINRVTFRVGSCITKAAKRRKDWPEGTAITIVYAPLEDLADIRCFECLTTAADGRHAP